MIFATDEWFEKIYVSESAGRLVKTQTVGPSSKVSFPVGLWVGTSICISNQFSGDIDAAGLGSTL